MAATATLLGRSVHVTLRYYSQVLTNAFNEGMSFLPPLRFLLPGCARRDRGASRFSLAHSRRVSGSEEWPTSCRLVQDVAEVPRSLSLSRSLSSLGLPSISIELILWRKFGRRVDSLATRRRRSLDFPLTLNIQFNFK